MQPDELTLLYAETPSQHPPRAEWSGVDAQNPQLLKATRSTLAAIEKILKRPGSTHVRYIPLPPFENARENAPVAEAAHDRRWPMIEMLGPALFNYRSVLHAGPNIWQMEPIVHNACAEKGIPLAIGIAHGIPVSAEMAKQLRPVVAIVSAAQAEEFRSLLSPTARVDGTYFILVSHLASGEMREFPPIFSPHMNVLELMPGFPLAHTCPETEMHENFHLSGEYFWYARGDGGISIIPASPEIPWFGVLDIPLSLKPAGACTCKRPLFTLRYVS